MDLSTKGLVFDHPVVQGRDLDEFVKKYRSLTADELKISLKVTINEFTSVLSQSVPCVGCRRSVERLFFQLMLSGHPTLGEITKICINKIFELSRTIIYSCFILYFLYRALDNNKERCINNKR